MTPTMELRFVKRMVTDVPGKPYEIRPVLQQKWVNEYTYPDERTTHVESEWRDVPLVKEVQS